MDEVHGPDLIGCGSCATIVVAQLRLYPSLRRLVAQLQAQFVVNAMGLLQVDLPPFTTQKDMDASVAVQDACRANLFDPSFETDLLAATGFVMIGGPIEFQDAARPPDRDAPIIANRSRASSRLRAGLTVFGGSRSARSRHPRTTTEDRLFRSPSAGSRPRRAIHERRVGAARRGSMF